MESSGFQATLRRVYRLADTQLLVLKDGYQGDVGPGDALSVELSEGEPVRVEVKDLAWGSAFQANQPPLTIIVTGLGEAEQVEGAVVRSFTP